MKPVAYHQAYPKKFQLSTDRQIVLCKMGNRRSQRSPPKESMLHKRVTNWNWLQTIKHISNSSDWVLIDRLSSEKITQSCTSNHWSPHPPPPRKHLSLKWHQLKIIQHFQSVLCKKAPDAIKATTATAPSSLLMQSLLLIEVIRKKKQLKISQTSLFYKETDP